MSRQYKNGSCSCWKKVNASLDGYGCSLDISFTMSGHEYLNIAVYREKGKKVVKRVVASHCPFCGNKLLEPKELL